MRQPVNFPPQRHGTSRTRARGHALLRQAVLSSLLARGAVHLLSPSFPSISLAPTISLSRTSRVLSKLEKTSDVKKKKKINKAEMREDPACRERGGSHPRIIFILSKWISSPSTLNSSLLTYQNYYSWSHSSRENTQKMIERQ